MDSINKQQAEDNFENLHGAAATKKMKEIAEQAKTCFFCTEIKTNKPFSVRPMYVQKIDSEGNFWFLSSKDSHKNMEINKSDFVQLLFQGSPHSDFLTLSGTATISDNKRKIKELWEPLAKTWFTDGVDDPRITVIKFTPTDGYYWDNKHGNTIAFAKMLAGAAIGKTLDDSIEGAIAVGKAR